MNQTVNIKGKSYPLEKVIAISGLGPKGVFSKEDALAITGLATAIASEAVSRVVYLEFEGKKIAVIKPLNPKYQNTDSVPPGTEYSFLTNQLIKKLAITDKPIVDTSPLIAFNDHQRPRNNFDNQSRSRGRNDQQERRYSNQDYRNRSY